MWEFETEPEFQEKLDWAERFVREEVEPLDALWRHRVFERPVDPVLARIIGPLKQQVRDQGLWACHLGPELGGQGYGQVKLALLNEIIGRAAWGPVIFGTAAPDTGNAEILAHYGTDEQKRRYLQPLLDGDIVSCFAMTEPQGGSDPRVFTTRAVREGDDWVINGLKFMASHAKWAAFYIVMAVTNPDVDIHRGASMFIVPGDTPGIEIERNMALFGHEPPGEGTHGLVRFTDVRVPAENVLGGEGQAFAISQTRLGGGRIHHAMRTVSQARRALDMMVERALSRETRGSLLAKKQSVQNYVADSYAELMQFRLFVLYVAWRIDKLKDYQAVRHDIAAVKVLTPQVMHNITQRALQVHGALGTTSDLPLNEWFSGSMILGLADGPSEVHRVTVARAVLAEGKATEGLWPTQWLPLRQEQARKKYAEFLEPEEASK
ncbi:acyl-CoA dehydrogenase family protein [Frankia sp. CNm7]|uniref:Acyl-CoA dehydrogenase family protein n=1 Tax=Frankia nepalensis TaxID=1836974 RepID=A0A937RIW5_9ACTN|nr:acyl-CoA dehydrogenase family protein [Frankia nepalensis]MBL7499999.1 acyl-CoA dehydrogenase family protein [Frankia nepalensis]MBL7510655.1 acyl-CoA dehydrogenase family protein [Frankia nepalensis]MBL7520764.1 acyl-CoA dehydrogenase family protein [Frankia nepalensis]MBL7627188.1 acyl-CoA dehydrogenase family protein [Frankia nepalensis]